MSISTKEFKEQLKKNKEYCFCGEKLKKGRNGELYCPRCNVFEPGLELGGITYLNGCREEVRA